MIPTVWLNSCEFLIDTIKQWSNFVFSEATAHRGVRSMISFTY